jgi:hypothetical protein
MPSSAVFHRSVDGSATVTWPAGGAYRVWMDARGLARRPRQPPPGAASWVVLVVGAVERHARNHSIFADSDCASMKRNYYCIIYYRSLSVTWFSMRCHRSIRSFVSPAHTHTHTLPRCRPSLTIMRCLHDDAVRRTVRRTERSWARCPLLCQSVGPAFGTAEPIHRPLLYMRMKNPNKYDLKSQLKILFE